MIKNIKYLLLASLAIVACDKKEDEVVLNNSSDGLILTAGTANFTKYVAVGNSLSAGFSDGALFKEAQKTSWTAILADQFKLVGGGEYKIPFMADNVGGFLKADGTQNFSFVPRLYWNVPLPPASAGPGLVPGISSAANSTLLTGGFNNMGVPGAKSFHLGFAGYGAFNPYFGRFASSPTATILGDAMAQAPTFFTCWIGNNDVLSYSTNGGDGTYQLNNFNPATYGQNDITDPTAFAGIYSNIINTLTANGAKGAVANIPDVTSLPYFYAVQYNQLTQANLTVEGVNKVAELNAKLYKPLKDALTFLGQPDRISLLAATGNNVMLMKDKTLTDLSAQLTAVLTQGLILQGVPAQIAAATAGVLGPIFGQVRQTNSTDLICLSAGSRIGRAPNLVQDGTSSPSADVNALGVSFPLPDKYVLTAPEVVTVTNATNAFNASIKSIATAKGLAFVDANAILKVVASTGITSNGYIIKSAYVAGGAFSLDGVHPTPRGYALLANKFIEEINKTYGSNLNGVNLGNYRTLFPKNL